MIIIITTDILIHERFLLTHQCAAEWTPSSPQPELLLSWPDLVC